MVPIDYSKQLKRKLAEGRSFEDALRELRAEGASIIDSIRTIKQLYGCDLAEAKRVVHFSAAWADMKDHHDKFHEELEKAGTQIDTKKPQT